MPTIPLKVKIKAQLLREEFGCSFADVAKRCGVSKSSVFYWTKFLHRPRSNAKRGPTGLHHSISDVVLAAVSEQPLTTAAMLREIIAEKLQIVVSLSTIYKTLRILKISHKNASRSRDHQPVKRNHPFFSANPYLDDAMMFDESGFYLNDRPRKGWSVRGTRVPKGMPSARRRLSLLLVTDRCGIVAKRVLAGGVKGFHVSDFLKELPEGRPLLLDNASVHKTKEVKALCAQKRITLNYLPPYSPWYNPVENAFAQAKKKFRQLRLHGSDDLVGDIEKSVLVIKNFEGMFQSSKGMWEADRAR